MDTGDVSDLKRSGSINSSTNGNDNDKNNENRLYDREKERQILVDRFEAVHRGTRKGNELVLVTGPRYVLACWLVVSLVAAVVGCIKTLISNMLYYWIVDSAQWNWEDCFVHGALYCRQ